MSVEEISQDIQNLKQQKKILIHNINKLQNNVKTEEELINKKLDEKYKKLEEEYIKKFKIKQQKLEQELFIKEKRNKRKQKRTIKIKKTKNKTFSTQTENINIKEVSIQTETIKNINPITYSFCKDILNNCIKNLLKKDMSIQCNLSNNKEKSLNLIKNKETDDLYMKYKISHFKNLSINSKINKIINLNENTLTNLKMHMLGLFNSQNEIYNITITNKFLSSMNIRFYNEYTNIFTISYNFITHRHNTFCIKGTNDNPIRISQNHKLKLKSNFIIKLVKTSEGYNILFNKNITENISISEPIKYINCSETELNIIYQ